MVDNHGLPLARRHQISDFLWAHMQKNVSVETIAKARYSVLCTEGGNILGTALLFADENNALNLQSLCVHKNRRCEGIGSDILNEAKLHSKQLQIPAINLHVDLPPIANETLALTLQKWYERHGFVPLQRTEKDVLLQWNSTADAV